jgi:hypothetical protein
VSDDTGVVAREVERCLQSLAVTCVYIDGVELAATTAS